ncbi:MAG: DUF4111 domain-containing protein [Burkholderiales bacterium]|nr:DUF4111 domain-containing protein [Anaerolineae bacterium]
MLPQPTPYYHINALLDDLLIQIRAILDDKLVGVYLTGSLVTGDFDADISDIDLLAAITSDLTETEFSALERMHSDFVVRYPQWDNRIEVLYYSLHGLRTYKTERTPIAVISPGEPFHYREEQAGIDWLMNWHIILNQGVTLFGPPPNTIIEAATTAEFIEVVRDHALSWPNWLTDDSHRGYQSYAILTLCRAMYAIKYGEQVSKLRAAEWAANEFPAWATLIKNALVWRKAAVGSKAQVDHAATLPATRRFLAFVVEHISSMNQ